MALTRTQQIELNSLLKQKLSAQIIEESDQDVAAWTQAELIGPMSEAQQEALYDDLLEQIVAAQTAKRDQASTHFSDVLTVLEDKRRGAV